MVWWCGGVVVWWCGGVVVWWCGGVVVCSCVLVFLCWGGVGWRGSLSSSEWDLHPIQILPFNGWKLYQQPQVSLPHDFRQAKTSML